MGLGNLTGDRGLAAGACRYNNNNNNQRAMADSETETAPKWTQSFPDSQCLVWNRPWLIYCGWFSVVGGLALINLDGPPVFGQ